MRPSAVRCPTPERTAEPMVMTRPATERVLLAASATALTLTAMGLAVRVDEAASPAIANAEPVPADPRDPTAWRTAKAPLTPAAVAVAASVPLPDNAAAAALLTA